MILRISSKGAQFTINPMGVVMKGIILAGGHGTRLYPLSKVVNKQLLPIHDKPLIFYPLTTLISSGVSDIQLISGPAQIEQFKELLGEGKHLGIKLSYGVQPEPNGIAEAFLIAENFILNDDVTLILGDNLFVDSGEIRLMVQSFETGATVLGYQVSNPNRFGVVEYDSLGKPKRIVEKPENPKSKTVVPGLYVFGADVCKIAKTLRPSKRGELEITDLMNCYLSKHRLTVKNLSRGSVWIDAGTTDSISRAGRYVATVEENHGMKIGCPEEAALVRNFISPDQLATHVNTLPNCAYRDYLKDLIWQRPLVKGRH